MNDFTSFFNLEICELPPEAGDCVFQPTHDMWYYDSGIGDCLIFSYSGCGGNQNRFPSQTACLETCRPQTVTPLINFASSEQNRDNEEVYPEGSVKPSVEEPLALTDENESEDVGSLEPNYPREPLATFPPLIYNLSIFEPQAVGRLTHFRSRLSILITLLELKKFLEETKYTLLLL